MLRANKRKKQVYMETSLPMVEINHLVVLSFALLMIICLYPEVSFAKSTFEGQLDTINTLGTGKGKTVGISVATVLVTIVSIVKGNLKLAGAAVATGVFAALYLQWVGDGMKMMI